MTDPLKHLREDMVSAMRSCLGSGLADEYYENEAGPFVDIAAQYIKELVLRERQRQYRRNKRKVKR